MPMASEALGILHHGADVMSKAGTPVLMHVASTVTLIATTHAIKFSIDSLGSHATDEDTTMD